MSTPAPNPANVVLLMPFAGLNGDPINKDYSATPKASTIIGYPRLSNVVSRGGYDACAEFPRDGFIVSENNAAFNLSGQWVVEAFVFLPHAMASVGGSGIAELPFFSFMDRTSNSNRLQFYLFLADPPTYPSVTCWSDASAGTFYMNEGQIQFGESYFNRWVHVAFQRNNTGKVQLFLDGVLRATSASSATPLYRNFITINATRNSGVLQSAAVMYMSDLRVTCGEAFYPSSGFELPEYGYVIDGSDDPARRVAGTLKVNSVAVARDIIVVSNDPAGRKIVGEGKSEDDGAFDILYRDWDGAVTVIGLDDYGLAFHGTTPIDAGKVVHPTVPNGYVYVATTGGTTGPTEPEWSTDAIVISGSVIFSPRAYHRPVGAGPMQGELVE